VQVRDLMAHLRTLSVMGLGHIEVAVSMGPFAADNLRSVEMADLYLVNNPADPAPVLVLSNRRGDRSYTGPQTPEDDHEV